MVKLWLDTAIEMHGATVLLQYPACYKWEKVYYLYVCITARLYLFMLFTNHVKQMQFQPSNLSHLSNLTKLVNYIVNTQTVLSQRIP